eukprot:TRINITY_DN10183_c0_g1_i1.p1 TRINITY_DN10183_c0_g1~~TRINITY_DN10183_c0_g1_i1.p1  ORF type:complete len:707 (-),score=130.49 TRINITY_DN10183_c0_g1_i1:2-2122(-)
MPFSKPVPGRRDMWNIIDKNDHFSLQEKIGWFGKDFRILISHNNYLIATAKDRNLINTDWESLCKMCTENEELKVLLTSPSGQIGDALLEFFHSHAENNITVQPTKARQPAIMMKDMKPKAEVKKSTKDEFNPSKKLVGWLGELTPSGMNNKLRWRNRYFILTRGCLFYNEITVQKTFRLEELVIDDTASHTPTTLDADQQLGYRILISNKKFSLQFATKTEQELHSWQSIFSAINLGKDALGNDEYEDIYNSDEENEKPPKTKKRGFAFVYTQSRWKYCLLVLKDKDLQINETIEKGFFPLLNCKLDIISDEMAFEVVSPTRGTLCLQASNLTAMERWIAHIQKTIDILNTNDPNLVNSFNELGMDPEMRNILERDDRESIRMANTIRDILEGELLELKTPAQRQSANSNRLNILSLDGGGVRGIMNTVILSRLVEILPDLMDHIHFCVGCSNGGMVAMGLAFGLSPTSCRHMIELNSNIVFGKRELRASTPIGVAKWHNYYLKLLCDEAWKKARLKEAKKYVLVPAFLLDNQAESNRQWEIRLFHNLSPDDAVSEEFASDVVMRTSAAPTYFPSFQRYIDGGIFAHDPASCALTYSMSRLGKDLKDIRILSMGTGKVARFVPEDDHNWGLYQWFPQLPNLLWDGMIQKSETICSELLGDRYLRINPLLPTDIPMDDPNQVGLLTQIAKQLDLTQAVEWIKRNFY